jgi:hypothetical protein
VFSKLQFRLCVKLFHADTEDVFPVTLEFAQKLLHAFMLLTAEMKSDVDHVVSGRLGALFSVSRPTHVSVHNVLRINESLPPERTDAERAG